MVATVGASISSSLPTELVASEPAVNELLAICVSPIEPATIAKAISEPLGVTDI
jgi:hypothetical protein